MTTNNEIERAVKIVAEYMGYPISYRYLISKDGGEAYSIKFNYKHEADNYLKEHHDKGWDLEYSVVKKEHIWWDYSQSLDSLVPVWEKLDCVAIFDKMAPMYACELHFKNAMGKVIGLSCAKTIQLAALLATAKAIELRNERTENTGGLNNSLVP